MKGINLFIITDEKMKKDILKLIDILQSKDFKIKLGEFIKDIRDEDDDKPSGKDYKVNWIVTFAIHQELLENN